jgi:outer membrane protein assembly factor BamB
MSYRFSIAWALIAAFLGSPIHAEDWPMFGRDQSRNAVSPEKNPPVWWQVETRDRDGNFRKPNKNVRWSAVLTHRAHHDGRTYGDPIVIDGTVWIGTNNEGSDGKGDAAVLVCLDQKTGKVLYRYVSPRLEPFAGQDWPNKSLACSPLIEGDRMWFTTNRCEVVCLDIGPLKKRQGEPRALWKVDMRADLAVCPRASLVDYRLCSLAADPDRLYAITGHGVDGDGKVAAPEAPSLVCFDKLTGKVIWKDNSPGKDILFSQYASPTVIQINGQTQVVAPQGDGWVRSFEGATGKLLWKFDTNPPDAEYDPHEGPEKRTRNYLPASAVFHENRLYIGNGQEPESYSGPACLYCIDPTRSGDISPHVPDGPGKGKPNPNSGMIWKYGGVDPKTEKHIFDRTVSNVAIHRGLVIAADMAGTVHCLDARSGKPYWVHETQVGFLGFLGSPLIVDGKIYVGDCEGSVWILELAKEKKVLDRIEMDREVNCSPVFANGVLYVATNSTLYAIAGKEKKRTLRPVVASDPKVTQKWLADLDSNEFEVRKKAQDELIALGEGIIPALKEALAKKPALEVSRRLEGILEEFTRPTPDYLEMIDALHALERIGTDEARRQLESLARGFPDARQTLEAQNALQRLAERAAK